MRAYTNSDVYHLTHGILFPLWIFELVGEDVVSELNKAMERVGLDMRVAALVSVVYSLLFS